MADADAVRQAIAKALRTVIDPTSGRDVVSLGLAKQIAYCGGVARITYELPSAGTSGEVRASLREQTEAALTRLEAVQQVHVDFRVVQRRSTDVLPGVRHVVAVGAGKGGVGKSTIAVILAVGLRRRGLKVALLDGDVYGPSLPKLTGTESAEPVLDDQGRVIPAEFEGIKLLSMGHLVPRDEAVIWRGPLAQKYVKEFLDRGAWGELDYLIVDLPPGTGDIPLTLAQSVPLTGAVVVCTPQELALLDAIKALRMYQKLGVAALGMVENMSWYVCPHCGHREYVFGRDGVRRAAEKLGVPFLGEIPLNLSICQFGDAGQPTANFTQTPPEVAAALDHFVDSVHAEVERRSRQRRPLPQLKIES
jgi:ATP-binding protein involved in chromosome partitioning